MKSKVKKLITFSLGIVITLASLGWKDWSNEKSEENKIIKYNQQKIELPEEQLIQNMIVLDDKSIVIAAINPQRDICILNLKNEEGIWSERKIGLPKEEGKLNSILQTNVLNNGNILIFYSSSDINSESVVIESVDIKYIIVDKNGNRKNVDAKNINYMTTKLEHKYNSIELYKNSCKLIVTEDNKIKIY
ncbi:hypothetical protein [Paraclostridium bifermentans]|uniref:hypothetical protein n=1 Tax=Paraclostridium bifermentans TaxID=1490 RepID=UPI0003F8F5CA|nr:hypothetical protein [Paraclostridium bifermentans]